MAEIDRIITDAIEQMEGIDFLTTPTTLEGKDAFIRHELPVVLEGLRTKALRSKAIDAVTKFDQVANAIRDGIIGVTVYGDPRIPKVVNRKIKLEEVKLQYVDEKRYTRNKAPSTLMFSIHRSQFEDLWFTSRHPRIEQVFAPLALTAYTRMNQLMSKDSFVAYNKLNPNR